MPYVTVTLPVPLEVFQEAPVENVGEKIGIGQANNTVKWL